MIGLDALLLYTINVQMYDNNNLKVAPDTNQGIE